MLFFVTAPLLATLCGTLLALVLIPDRRKTDIWVMVTPGGDAIGSNSPEDIGLNWPLAGFKFDEHAHNKATILNVVYH